MERWILADGDNDSEWHSAEATMRPDAARAQQGRAMRFHIDVNHETGEPKYPIGWPRTYLSIAEKSRDWRRWDFLEFWVYASTSRDRLPNSPLGFLVRSPNKANSYHRTISEAQKDQWTHVRVPISDMPHPDDCTAVQFFIAESDYHHGDVLDFWIDDLVLARYAEPTILNMRPLGLVQYADADVIRIEVRMTGLEKDHTAELLAWLFRDSEPILACSATVHSGVGTVPLKIGGNLSAGHYELRAKISGSPRTVSRTLRVISSPWEEETP